MEDEQGNDQPSDRESPGDEATKYRSKIDFPSKRATVRGRRYSIAIHQRRPSTSVSNENRLFVHSREEFEKRLKATDYLEGSDKSNDSEEDTEDAKSTTSAESSLDSLAELQNRIQEIRNARKNKIATGSIFSTSAERISNQFTSERKNGVEERLQGKRFENKTKTNNITLTTGKQLPLNVDGKITKSSKKLGVVGSSEGTARNKSRRKFGSDSNIVTSTLSTQTTGLEKHSKLPYESVSSVTKRERRNSAILSKLVSRSVKNFDYFDKGIDFDPSEMNLYQRRKSLRRGSLFTRDDVTIASRKPADKRRSSLAVPFRRSRRRSSAFNNDVTHENARRYQESASHDHRLDVEMLMKKKAAVLERFRRAVRIVKICVKLCIWSLLKAVKEKTSYTPLGHLSSGGALMFDPAYYKAKRQQRLSDEVKLILQKHPTERSEKDLKYVQIALRNIRSFAVYPIRMQRKLCRVGWLEEFGPGRAIVRQGHPPTAFYFIICGSLVVSVLNMANGKRTPQAVAYLNRGDSFGELAILNNTRRASTVITEEDAQLLCISVQDYEDIFMVSGGIKHVNDPDQHSFITSLRFLQHWPIEILQSHPKDCLFHFFKAGDLLVKESHFSSWIYIIKSGSCSVLASLKQGYVSKGLRKTNKTPAQQWHQGSAVVLDDVRLNSITRKIRPHSSAGNVGQGFSESFPLKQRRVQSANVTANESKISATTSQTSLQRTNVIDDLTPQRRRGSTIPSQMPLSVHDLQKLRDLSAGKVQSNTEDSQTKEKTVSFDFTIQDIEEEDGGEREDTEADKFVEQRRTFHSDLDKAEGPMLPPELKKKSLLAVVQVLQKGDVFGLQDIVYGDQPNLTLVSNGAECIMIRKQFYLNEAKEDTLRILRKEVIPYPSTNEMQEYLQQQLDWDAFKNSTLSSTVYESRATKTQRLRPANSC